MKSGQKRDVGVKKKPSCCPNGADTSVRAFRIADYDAVNALWRRTEGVGLNESDTRRAIAAYLRRNPRLSFVAGQDGRIVGAVLCGHDGRRGYRDPYAGSYCADSLRDWRKKNGFSLDKAALVLNMSPNEYRDYEYGYRMPNMKQWEPVKDHLRGEVDYSKFA